MVLANRLNQTLDEVLSDEDVQLPDNFDQMTLNDQAMVALQSSLMAAQNKCDGGFLGIDTDCDEEAIREINELLAYAHTQRINNSLSNAMANSHVRSGGETRFVGGSRELIAGAGGFFAPLGVAWKSAIGGFEAGTYSKIMPQIVAFGIALTIMLTPFLYMVGLLVPQFALNVILIPIIGVFYFGTVKVIFTIINILASIFIEADEMNLLHGLQANFPDVVLGNLYGAAFLISAGLLYVFRDPSALVKQASGSADKSSTISWQEAAGTALLGQQVLGGLGKVANPATAGQISGAIHNLKSGNVSLSDSYVNARNDIIQSGEESALGAEHARNMPPETREQSHSRARAKAADDLEARGLEYAKGVGAPSSARKATKYEELDGQYSKPVEHDPAVTQLAEALQKRIGLNARSAQWMAAKAFRNGGPATVQKQTKGPPLVDLDLDAIDRSSDMHMKAFVQELKRSGAMSEFSDIKTRRRKGRIDL
ncbi:hypothetical protein CVT23_20900 [Minwuia thermotolerans]|uniref:Uncharacterized protein n=2 Tax=Minwuia thermotolerans TaxID=2056226 RepID=A0A2M9FW55_9PROT|nr:hypothetical protein CVT23_20900 [Minwuia thermotolerans]